MQGRNDLRVYRLYESKVIFPILLSLALLFGLFQNCSSTFESENDPIENQNSILNTTAIVLSDSPIFVVRLEGSPIAFTVPSNIFNDQGISSCPSAIYNWSFVSSGNSGAPSPIAAVSGPALQISSLSMADEGSFFVDIQCQGQLYNLGPAALDVVPRLTLASAQVSDQSVNQGSPFSLSAEVTGPSPINYQWYFTPDSGTQVALAGEISQTLSISSAQLSNRGFYQLLATSAEGGIGQSLVVGPGLVNIIPISSISGSVSGSTQIIAGDPIQLSSSVSGASDPVYQWYFNNQAVSGETGPELEIPVSEVSDSGTYSLIVDDGGNRVQIGSLDITVSCAPGQIFSNQQCLANSNICPIINGTGIQFLNDEGEFGSCLVTSCDPGYVSFEGKCVPSVGDCPIQFGVGTFTYDPDGYPTQCVVESCNPGYLKVDNKCVPMVCSIENGLGTIKIDSQGRSSCQIAYCNADYVQYEGNCVPRVQSCPIDNGSGTAVYSSQGPGICNVYECNSGFVNINNSCVARDCPVQNGQGLLSLSPTGSVKCQAISCDSGYFMYNNQCSSQSCTIPNGEGYWVIQNGQRKCEVSKCGSGYIKVNGSCEPSFCQIANGIGVKSINSSGQISCIPESCDKDYVISNFQCVPGEVSCPIRNGKGYKNSGESDSQCKVRSCNSNYVAYNNSCVKEVQSCSISNGKGEQIFTSAGPGECILKKCNSGYLRHGNSCVPRKKECYVANGEGYQEAYSNGYGPCKVKRCDSGYGATLTEQCLPEKRLCFLGAGVGYEYLTPYGYSACKIDECPGGFSALNGFCYPNEKLLCEPMDPDGNASKAKIFGRIYSIIDIKSSVSIYSATQESDRLNGEVFLNDLLVERSSLHPYLVDYEGKRVQHSKGAFLKDWFALKLYTDILPPDGASEGEYIFGIASDDGSALDSKSGASWVNFINNGSGSSCDQIKSAIGAVKLSKKQPFSARLRYFQNSGSSRCFKLYYKKKGSSGSFKKVSSKYLRLPFNTQNRCPNRRTPDANPNNNVTPKELGYVPTSLACTQEILKMYNPKTKECMMVKDGCEKTFGWAKGFSNDIYNYCY